MKAMILAAARVPACVPITHTIPKPMIPHPQKPVMEFLLDIVCGNTDLTRWMVNVSTCPKKLKIIFATASDSVYQIAYQLEGRIEDWRTDRPPPLGSAGGIKKVSNLSEIFDGPTLWCSCAMP